MWEQDEYHFYGQRADEHVMLVRLQHPVVLHLPILIDVLILVVLFLIHRFLPGLSNFYLTLIVFIGLITHISYYVYGYRNSVCILSDQRIVNVLQRGFFNKKITEAEVSRIQDVSTTVTGVMQTMFGFGNVTIRTASDNTLILKNIHDPYDVQQAVVRMLREGSEVTPQKKSE